MATPTKTNQDAEPAKTEKRTIPVVQEFLHIDKKCIEVGTVVITKQIREEDTSVEIPVTSEEVFVEKKIINQYIQEEPPQVRQEGETTIVPIYKEVFVVEKKLLLVEELHITKKSIKSTVKASDTLRKEEVILTRTTKDNL